MKIRIWESWRLWVLERKKKTKKKGAGDKDRNKWNKREWDKDRYIRNEREWDKDRYIRNKRKRDKDG